MIVMDINQLLDYKWIRVITKDGERSRVNRSM